MRAAAIVSGIALPVGLATAALNITETNDVDSATGVGELGWGASDLAFGYSAGVGLNFSSGIFSPFHRL